MKIAVYAIAYNEEKFALRWFESMREADYVVVLDTGSTDDTARILAEAGASVASEKIVPWRFDVARNRALGLVPEDADVCVSTDLDEVFEPGWRAALEAAWTADAERGRYRYIWSHVGGAPGVEFFIEKAHRRRGFRWVYPVHEVLVPESGRCVTVTLSGVTAHHYPDESKSRASYLPLLELAAAESPGDDRIMHYLGREYMFRGEYARAVETLKRHLALPNATWEDERAASMRFIARCDLALRNEPEAERWLLRAVAEAPKMREACVEYARLLYARKDWNGVVFFINRALAVTERSASYINEPFAWGALPYDLMSIALYNLGDNAGALRYVNEAILRSDDPRLQSNRNIFLDKSKGK